MRHDIFYFSVFAFRISSCSIANVNRETFIKDNAVKYQLQFRKKKNEDVPWFFWRKVHVSSSSLFAIVRSLH